MEDRDNPADVQDERCCRRPGKCRGVTLLSQVHKLLVKVLDGQMRVVIDCENCEEKQLFGKLENNHLRDV